MTQIDKQVSFKIENQFPAIYRENGRELVQLVEEYYKFVETAQNQHVYNSRRLFEYKDIDTTLNELLIYFKNKFLSDLPFNDETIQIVVKNIMSLYRRRGTEEGLKLFFRLFFEENAEVYYPARDIFKASDSEWKVGTYIRLFPNEGKFKSVSLDQEFTYRDLLGKTIVGSNSQAKAVVDKINFVLLRETIYPILYLNSVFGTFEAFDKISTLIEDQPIQFGEIYGSMTDVEIDTNYKGTTNNEIGDVLDVKTENGFGGKVIVNEVTENFTGQISYEVLDGGFGYTIDNTRLHVSNQNIQFEGNTQPQFEVFETLQDQFGNEGFVVGQNENFVGIKMNANSAFSNSSNISTLDRDTNLTFDSSEIFFLTEKNDTSPGPLFPETGNPNSVKVGEINNTESVSLITDVIGDYLNVPLNSSNYNDVPPALKPMSGNTDPININNRLDEAFDLTPFEIGSIVNFVNINPGEDYVNDVFAVAEDPVMGAFNRFRQIITLNDFSAAFSIGTIIKQGSVRGKIEAIEENSLFVLPFSYYGFNDADPIALESGGEVFTIASISTDYGSSLYGFNAEIDAETNFATGKILDVNVIDSGFGYFNSERAQLVNASGEIQAEGEVKARGAGVTEGFWSTLNSHLNGYTLDDQGEPTEYFNSGKFIQDSDFYQEYSYQVKSKLGIETYRDLLKEINHVAGSKMFGKFVFQELASSPTDIELDLGFGFDENLSPTADSTDVTVDSINITIDSV